MKPIPYETALALTRLIEAAARQLNQHIADAAKLGMTVEANLIEVRQISDASPTPFVDVTAKVRPDQISLTPGEGQAPPLQRFLDGGPLNADSR
ncbi:hypothetical protein RCKEMMY_41 [Rhodobacter phage RcKemmy]|nr:hypothetical protein RCKEMMY_41 [Rhodobacter phage RcKemmy]